MEGTIYSPEDRYSALSSWWERYQTIFSSWYSNMPMEQQKQLLLKASPDMPTKSPLTKSSVADAVIQSTDMLLPELNLDAFLSNNDVLLLHGQLKRGLMPSFCSDHLNEMDTPFVDPLDTDENIRSLSPQTSPEAREQVLKYLESGRLIHAEAFVCLKIRRAAIVTFVEILILECQKAYLSTNESDKNSTLVGKHVFEPNYEQLIVAEVAQSEYFNDPSNLPNVNKNNLTAIPSTEVNDKIDLNDVTTTIQNEENLEEIS